MMSFVKNMSRIVGMSTHLKIGNIGHTLIFVNGMDE